jgi:serine/threonine protein kinase
VPTDETSLPPSLATRFQPRRLLGQGGFGRVLLATDGGDPVALKVLHADLVDDSFRQRFAREAEVALRVRHPSVVQLLDHGISEEDVPYLVYQYVESEDLAARIERDGAQDPNIALEWALDLADALSAVHEAGVLHRDLSPGNVLITPEGRAVLSDFGAARPVEGGGFQTAAGVLIGTPGYMAPELFDFQAPSEAADQFAWAATIAGALVGEPPYGGTRPVEVLQRIARGGALRLPDAVVQRIPQSARVLEQALSLDPEARMPAMPLARRALAIARMADAQGGDLETTAPTSF